MTENSENSNIQLNNVGNQYLATLTGIIQEIVKYFHFKISEIFTRSLI